MGDSLLKLYTSYWAQVRNFPTNLIVLNTTIWPPKQYNVGGVDKRGVISLNCTPLRPGHTCDNLCNGKCVPKHPQDCAFLKKYREQLDAIDFNEFMRKIIDISDRMLIDFPEQKDFDIAFVFFEKYDNPCSERWVVQDWFRAHGVEIEEWQPNI